MFASHSAKRSILLALICLFVIMVFSLFSHISPPHEHGITFQETEVGAEYARNRDGYIIKLSDHLGIMKLHGEDDELIYIKNPLSNGMSYRTVLKAEINDWRIDSESVLRLTIEKEGVETEISLDKDGNSIEGI